MASMSLRLVLVLLILLALVAMANAQPDSNGCDGMDWDWEWSFAMFGGTFANHELEELARFTSSPPPSCVSPTQPLAHHERDVNSLPSNAAPAEEEETFMPQALRRATTYAAVVQYGITSPQQQPMAMVPPMPQQPPADYFSQHRQVAQQAPSHPYPSMPIAGPSRTSTKTYADALRFPPAESHQRNNHAGAYMGNGNMHAQTLDGSIAQHQQELLGRDVTTNPNYHSGMNDNVQTLQGWISQPRTARDRLSPLDTNLLSPHTPLTHRSPGSVTSPSSSRLSTRRNKQQMRAGHHPYRCGDCGAGFDSPSDLTHHRRNHTPDEKRQHKCADCGKRFVFAKDLTRHGFTHAAKTIFCQFQWCKYSTKGFSRYDHYERHLRSRHADSVLQASQPSSLPGY